MKVYFDPLLGALAFSTQPPQPDQTLDSAVKVAAELYQPASELGTQYPWWLCIKTLGSTVIIPD